MVVQLIIVVPETQHDRELTRVILMEAGKDITRLSSSSPDLQYREVDVPDDALATLLRQTT